MDIIADHALRDLDAVAHLNSLQEVSERINAYTKRHHENFDAKLRHYLANASYQKALEHLSQ